MKYTHLFWDFNGTILADMQAGMDSTNQMLSARGLREMADLDEYREVFDFPIKEYYRTLGFDFEKETYEELAPMWVQLYNQNSKDCPMVAGVLETLEEVKKIGVKQIVFSATEREMLIRQLSELGITSYFDEIIGLDNIHAESKTYLARKWRNEHPNARILYVGDTAHDAENAKILGADCMLFTGGHQSRRRLEGLGCKLIAEITDILEYI